MRTLAGRLAVSVLFSMTSAAATSFLTVAQHDSGRSYLDQPSAAVSADGRFVAFTSFARLAPADTNNNRDIYVLDRTRKLVTLESLAPDGPPWDIDSDHPSLSSDGRFLVYQSDGKVVLRDRQDAVAKILAIGRAPAISADGRTVVFVSDSTTLVPGPDANGSGDDVYVIDVATGAIRRISVDSRGVQAASGASIAPSVSADGRYIAFVSTAMLDSGVVEKTVRSDSSPRPHQNVYVRDMERGVTTRVSVAAGRRETDGDSWAPVMSGDGRSVAFVSTATNLVKDDRNRVADVFVADLATRTIELISRSVTKGSGNGASVNPAISFDGRYVAFQSEASDLVCASHCSLKDEDINLLWDVFRFDRRDRVMIRASEDEAGGWLEASTGPALDASGAILAFSSRHPNDAADTKNDFDLFITDLCCRSRDCDRAPRHTGS
jgi:Tol biopolymer transport system component